MVKDRSVPHDDPQAVIDFAIEKEEEAIEFYNGLASKVKNKEVEGELLKIARMEEGHRDKLKKLDVSSGAGIDPVPVRDLKIANYLVEKEPTSDMSWQDVLTVAMKREQAAMELYSDMANVVKDPVVKQLFMDLAAEEKTHKFYFEAVYDDDVFREN